MGYECSVLGDDTPWDAWTSYPKGTATPKSRRSSTAHQLEVLRAPICVHDALGGIEILAEINLTPLFGRCTVVALMSKLYMGAGW